MSTRFPSEFRNGECALHTNRSMRQHGSHIERTLPTRRCIGPLDAWPNPAGRGRRYRGRRPVPLSPVQVSATDSCTEVQATSKCTYRPITDGGSLFPSAAPYLDAPIPAGARLGLGELGPELLHGVDAPGFVELRVPAPLRGLAQHALSLFTHLIAKDIECNPGMDHTRAGWVVGAHCAAAWGTYTKRRTHQNRRLEALLPCADCSTTRAHTTDCSRECHRPAAQTFPREMPCHADVLLFLHVGGNGLALALRLLLPPSGWDQTWPAENSLCLQ